MTINQLRSLISQFDQGILTEDELKVRLLFLQMDNAAKTICDGNEVGWYLFGAKNRSIPPITAEIEITSMSVRIKPKQ